MAIHSPAWAIAVNTKPVPLEHRLSDGTPMTAGEIALTQRLGITGDQLAAVKEMVAQANAGNKPLIKVENWTWILSVVPGLGQFVMGDQMRGILFFLGSMAPGVIGAVLGGIMIGTGAFAAFLPMWGIIGLVLNLASLAIWLWNLWDAYQMNQRMLGKSAEIQITPELRARRNDADVALNYTLGRF
jgi:hypothetical protein